MGAKGGAKRKGAKRGPYNTKRRQAEAAEQAASTAAEQKTAAALSAALEAADSAKKVAAEALAVSVKLAAQAQASQARSSTHFAAEADDEVEEDEEEKEVTPLKGKASKKRERVPSKVAELRVRTTRSKQHKAEVSSYRRCVSLGLTGETGERRAARLPPASRQGGNGQGRLCALDSVLQQDLRAR